MHAGVSDHAEPNRTSRSLRPVLPSDLVTPSALGDGTFAARWPACSIPYRRFAAALAGDGARLGASVAR